MTKICGLKFTHDAAICGIDKGRLVFCVEVEKLDNNPRYTKMIPGAIEKVLKHFNFSPDVFVVDGWKNGVGNGITSAFYHEFDGDSSNLLDAKHFRQGLVVEDEVVDYVSYPHMAGHVLGTYCTSPFAEKKEVAYVISFDGGQNPRVHIVNPESPSPVEYVTSLFGIYGIIYGIMGYYFGPYMKPEVWNVPLEQIAEKKLYGGYDIPGKLMSYIANGKVNLSLVDAMMGMYFRLDEDHIIDPLNYNQNGILEHALMREVSTWIRNTQASVSDADALATVHHWLQIMLVENAVAQIPKGSNLCFTGGSALNIKWNSALRRTGHFAAVYVPPFPNDSGSAIGAACCEMISRGRWALDWSVYCGQEIIMTGPLPGWRVKPFSLEALAELLHNCPEEPVVFLNGRTEVGPRALGNRSILCSAALPDTKTMLNKIKRREQFRPVAPICLEEDAPMIFKPGTPDPYMLFDHYIREEFKDVIPAVLHLDGTARLQTVSAKQNPTIHRLLRLYKALSGIGVLCNTSANLNGSGFFPSTASAMEWGGARYVWANELLYTKEN